MAYPIVWIGWQQGGGVYRMLLAEGLEAVYMRQARRFEFEQERDRLTFRIRGVPAFEAFLSAEGIDANVAFLITLLLVTPGMLPAGRLKRIGIGLASLYLTHLAFLVVKVEVTLIAAEHPLAGSIGLWMVADNFFEISGRSVFPILIWLALGLPYMFGKLEHATPQLVDVGRNDPCPCGSGRKFKRCCGQ